MGLKFVGLLAVAAFMAGSISATPDKIVCYLGSWANYRPGQGKFVIEDIDPNLCTHLIYTFVGLNPDGSVRILDPWLDIDLGGFKRFNALKERNPNLKTLVAIGGWNEGSEKYSRVAADPTLRAAFVKSAVEFVTTHGFDGFDLDWEYPGQRGGEPADVANFAALVKEFRQEFDKHDYLITAAVGATQSAIDLSYDVPTVSKYLHFINVMAYDLHGPWNTFTGINAPLKASEYDLTSERKQLNVEACINAWINAGADPSKLILGVPFYGRSFTLANEQNNGLEAPTTGPGLPGPWSGESGMVGYNELCYWKSQGGWTEVWRQDQLAPYTFKGKQWIGYDNIRAITHKVEFAQTKNLGGLMVWSVETDDFRGTCGSKYPLLTEINVLFGSDVSTPTPTPTDPTTPTLPTEPTDPTTETPPICTAPGFVRDPHDCGAYYVCTPDGAGGYNAVRMTCPGNLLWDTNLNTCNYPDQVDCST